MDDATATWLDLSSQFYLREADLGKNRAAVSHPRLSELNPYVNVSLDLDTVASKPDSFFEKFQAVVLSGVAPSQALRINRVCHDSRVPFIMVNARGLTGSLFVDCGPYFEVNDRNGEEPLEIMISEISKADPGVVKTLTGRRHGLEDGDYVRFSEVQGMTELNEFKDQVHRVRVLDPYSFSIGDTSAMSAYTGGGLATEVKNAQQVSFVDLATSLKQPEISLMDFAKMENPVQILIALQAVHTFAEIHHTFPRAWNEEDAAEVVKLADAVKSSMRDPVRDFPTIQSRFDLHLTAGLRFSTG